MTDFLLFWIALFVAFKKSLLKFCFQIFEKHFVFSLHKISLLYR